MAAPFLRHGLARTLLCIIVCALPMLIPVASRQHHTMRAKAHPNCSSVASTIAAECTLPPRNDDVRDMSAHTAHGRPGRPVAFLKTHKTGSTTVAAIFFRHAVAHGLLVPNQGLVIEAGCREHAVAEAVQRCSQQTASSSDGGSKEHHLAEDDTCGFDVVMSHLTPTGGEFVYEQRSGLNATRRFYQSLLHGAELQPSFWSTSGNLTFGVNIITLLRNPATRIRSHFDYYLRSTQRFRGSFSKWVAKGGHKLEKLTNYQCYELGLFTGQQVDGFIAAYTSTVNSSPIQFIMVVERTGHFATPRQLRVCSPIPHTFASLPPF